MYRYIKRGIDIVGSCVMLLLCCVPLLLIAIGLIMTQKKILFIQTRVGQNNQLFSIYKFLTMTSECDDQGNLLQDEERLTTFGSFLRKTSLDELPQLFNVLKGEMSFIGPRPLLVSYLPLYSPFECKRHLVKPGLTGLAQINGRNNISWRDKFKWDVLYVETISFHQDLKIFFLTIKKVLGRKDVSLDGQVTTLPFEGHSTK